MAQVGSSTETKILFTFEDSNCLFCSVFLKIGKGIVIQDCLHTFCRACLRTWIENQENVQIACPVGCGGKLLQSEIVALVGRRFYDGLEKKSYQKAINDMHNTFMCQTPKCKGWCEFGEGAKVYLCPLCNQTNCIACKAIHGDFTCEEYMAEKEKCISSGMNNIETYLRTLVDKRQKTSGFEQFIASMTTSAQGDEAGTSSGTYDNMMQSMVQQRLVVTAREFECAICFSDVPIGEGVILQECFHMFCKDCLISHVEHNEKPEVRCPQPSCTFNLRPREIQALLPPEILEKVTKRSWTLAESVIHSKFHCLTNDCNGFYELVGDVSAFQCSLCSKTNCISCNAIHESISCEDYKNRMKQNEFDLLSTKALENLVATGKAMICTCKAIVQKDVGCDWIVCTRCNTELCWATKGPRWGPRGKGDTTGGCLCRVNGKLCAPNCQNCH